MHYSATGEFVKNKETFTNTRNVRNNRIVRERFQNDTEETAQSSASPVQEAVQSVFPPVQEVVQSVAAPIVEQKPIIQSLAAPTIPPALAGQVESTFTHGGVTYIVGAQGPKGDRGDVGAQGPQGVQGPKGSEGAQGVQGKDGLRGPEGPKGGEGPQGPQGKDGVQGGKGEKGDKGDTGPVGPSGQDFDPTIYKSEICLAYKKLSEVPALKDADIYIPNFCNQAPYGNEVASAPVVQAPVASAPVASEGFRNVNGIRGFDSYGFNYSKY